MLATDQTDDALPLDEANALLIALIRAVGGEVRISRNRQRVRVLGRVGDGGCVIDNLDGMDARHLHKALTALFEGLAVHLESIPRDPAVAGD